MKNGNPSSFFRFSFWATFNFFFMNARDKKLNHKLMSRVGMYWVRKSQVSHHHAHLAKGSILYGNVCGLYNMSHPGFHLVYANVEGQTFLFQRILDNLNRPNPLSMDELEFPIEIETLTGLIFPTLRSLPIKHSNLGYHPNLGNTHTNQNRRRESETWGPRKQDSRVMPPIPSPLIRHCRLRCSKIDRAFSI